MRWVANAAGWSGAAFILSATLSLGWYIILLREYSSRESGTLLLWISASAIVGLLDFGISVFINGKIASYRHAKELDTAGLIAKFCLYFSFVFFLFSSVSAGLVIRSYSILPPLGFWQIFSFAILITGTQVGITSTAILKGYHQFKLGAICQIINSILCYGVSVIAMIMKMEISLVYVFMAVGSAVSAAISFYFALRISRVSVIRGSDLHQKFRVLRTHRKIFFIVFQGGSHIFPQQLAGVFFNHVLRFLVASLSGLEAVVVTSFSFTVATRLHSLCNAFIEILYPLANLLEEKKITARSIELLFWKRVFPYFILLAIAAAFVANAIKVGALIPTLLFSFGTWMALVAAPTFHFENAFGRSLRISILCLIAIPAYMLFLVGIGFFASYEPWVYGVAYFISQGIFYLQIRLCFLK